LRDAFLTYWRGILLATLLTVATVWLALSGRLGLYIHPRYFVFTVVMVAIGGVAVLAAFLIGRRGDTHAHAPAHAPAPAPAPAPDDPPPSSHMLLPITPVDHVSSASAREEHVGWRGAAAVAGSVVIVLVAAVALVALPPTTLSASLAGDREVNASIDTGDDAPVLVGGDTSAFTVKDWAVLIRQGGSDAVLRSADPTIMGFIVPIEGSSDSFSVARYSITCCAVDAQPFGVTVVMPGWQDSLEAGQWVEASGRFIENPDAAAANGWVLESSATVAIEEPSDPYVF